MIIKLLPLATLASLGCILRLLQEVSEMTVPSLVPGEVDIRHSKKKKIMSKVDARPPRLVQSKQGGGIIFPSSSSLTDDRPRNLRLAFLGDSVTRYQYLSLVFYLHTGRWIANDDDTPNLLLEKQFASWNDFFNETSRRLNGREQCDCFRAPGKINLQTSFENRYYRDAELDNYVTYIRKMNAHEAHGHWEPSEIAASDHALVQGSSSSYFFWQSNWTETVRQHIASLQPRPDYLIFNAGLWKQNDLHQGNVREELRHILDAHDIQGIYKTTTRRSFERRTFTDPDDVRACQVTHFCLNMSWTGRLNRTDYWDSVHFQPSVNQMFNEQLLTLLQDIQGGKIQPNEPLLERQTEDRVDKVLSS